MRVPLIPTVVASVTTYMERGGVTNVAECLKFLSDRLLLTGHGYDQPVTPAEHGIYMQDLEHATYDDWLLRAECRRGQLPQFFLIAHIFLVGIRYLLMRLRTRWNLAA